MEPLRSASVGLEEALAAAQLLLPGTASSKTGGLPLGLGQSVVFDLLLSMAMLSAGFFLLREPGMSRKRQAWILSALTSMPAATLSMSHVTRLLRHGWADIGPVVFSDDRLARFLCCFFAAFLLLDLGLGLRYYPEQIQLLSGWVHHILYLALMVWALSGHFTAGFCLFLPLELPTFILAMGSIYPERRSDLLFGSTFFATRICYHFTLLQRILRVGDAAPVPIWIPTLAAFALHVYWFALWLRGYTRRRLRLEQDKSAVGVGVGGAGAAAPFMAAPVGAGVSPTSSGVAKDD